jgi:hypothetical protein
VEQEATRRISGRIFKEAYDKMMLVGQRRRWWLEKMMGVSIIKKEGANLRKKVLVNLKLR